MLKSVRVIAGSLDKLYRITLLNAVHQLLTGVPYGMLFFLILELMKPREEVSIAYLAMLFASMALVMCTNIFLARRVYTTAFISSFEMCTDARLRLGNHLRRLSLGFFKRHDPGEISALLLQDMGKVEVIFSTFFMDVVACLVLPAMMCILFLCTNVQMTGLMVVSVLVALPLFFVSSKIVGILGRQHIATRNQAAAGILEYLQGMKTLKAFLLTGKGFARLDEVLCTLRKESVRLVWAASLPVLLYGAVLDAGFAALIVYGAFLVSEGELLVPGFILFLVIGRKFFEPLQLMACAAAELRYMNIAAERVSKVMDTPSQPEGQEAVYLQNLDITFDSVSFSYDGHHPVFSNLNLHIPAKSITALVGPSGSGKTTVASLIARFWDVDTGRITLGGVDVRAMPVEELYSLLSIVFQDVYLFQDTIFNNIKVGRKDATQAEVIAAAKVARCHECIESFEYGYETLVGEGGATLSGGEKQRISIARALLKDAPIVVLDEATASLDPENELHIQQALTELVRDKTLIVIAHRLKTIAGAEQIVVFDGAGNIAELGRHEELLRQEGVYAALWNEQVRTGGWKFASAVATQDT